MNNRNYQIIKKILSEIEILEELIEGFDIEKFTLDEKTKRACLYDPYKYRRAC